MQPLICMPAKSPFVSRLITKVVSCVPNMSLQPCPHGDENIISHHFPSLRPVLHTTQQQTFRTAPNNMCQPLIMPSSIVTYPRERRSSNCEIRLPQSCHVMAEQPHSRRQTTSPTAWNDRGHLIYLPKGENGRLNWWMLISPWFFQDEGGPPWAFSRLSISPWSLHFRHMPNLHIHNVPLMSALSDLCWVTDDWFHVAGSTVCGT